MYLTTIRQRQSEYCQDKVEGIIRQYSLSLREIIVKVNFRTEQWRIMD